MIKMRSNKLFYLIAIAFFTTTLLLNLALGDQASAAARTICNNACEKTQSPVCANNGITYSNTCLFNCAKKRNDRLKISKNGSCSKNTSLKEYRGQATSTTTLRPFSFPSPPRTTSSGGGSPFGGGSFWDSLFKF